MRVDLHSHTIYSDGKLTPEELVKRAKENGVDIFALTDHDSILGTDLAISFGKQYGVKVIRGIEVSTFYKGEPIHIVGLTKNNELSKVLFDYSNELIAKRKERAIIMMNKIKDYYQVKINIDKLLEAKTITRKNMLDHIIDNNDISYEEAAKMISKSSPCYVPSSKQTVKEGLELLDKANCFKILAHPCLISNKEYLLDIIDLGFDGMEVYYANDKNDVEFYKNLAKEHNLLFSAGSDCHGDSSHADIGTVYLSKEEFEPIANIIGLKI